MFRILGVALWLASALAVVLYLPSELTHGRLAPERLAIVAIFGLLGLAVVDLAARARRVWTEHRNLELFLGLCARVEAGHYVAAPYNLRDPRAIRRVNHIAECARPDISKLHEAIPAVASLDASILAGAYGPLGVYAWCLPVIGFMGTALGMADAIAGFKSALTQTQGDLTPLVSILGNTVVPGLANAFHITIIALAASLAVHLCTSALRDWDQEALTKLDRLCIVMLARIPLPEGPEGQRIVAAIERLGGTLGGARLEEAAKALGDGARLIAAASQALVAAGREMQEAASAPYVVTVERGKRTPAPPAVPSVDGSARRQP